MAVFHPDVEIVSITSVVYTPEWVVQPDVEITSTSEVEYTPPPSTGGQPNIVINALTVVSYSPSVTFTDIEGEAEFFISTTGAFDVEIVPVPIPFDIEMENVKRISVSMPSPTELDRFGRPV